MNDPRRPLPFADAQGTVELRRRRRARTPHRVAVPVVAVATAGVAALVVVAVRAGPTPPAAPGAPPVVLQGPAQQRPSQPRAPRAAPPFSPVYLRHDYLSGLADSVLDGGTDPANVRKVNEAYQIAEAWGLPLYPAAKAVAAKAALTGTDIHPRDPQGDDELINRFERAGYTDRYAETLAKAWSTDVHTAKVMGALVIDAG